MYVDLNPIRAGMARTPKTSDYTSIQRRLRPEISSGVRLALFMDEPPIDEPIPYYLRDYIQLVEWTGRATVAGKRGAIPANTPPIIERLGYDQARWLCAVRFFNNPVYKVIGPVDALRMLAAKQGRRWFGCFAQMKVGYSFNFPL